MEKQFLIEVEGYKAGNPRDLSVWSVWASLAGLCPSSCSEFYRQAEWDF